MVAFVNLLIKKMMMMMMMMYVTARTLRNLRTLRTLREGGNQALRWQCIWLAANGTFTSYIFYAIIKPRPGRFVWSCLVRNLLYLLIPHSHYYVYCFVWYSQYNSAISNLGVIDLIVSFGRNGKSESRRTLQDGHRKPRVLVKCVCASMRRCV